MIRSIGSSFIVSMEPYPTLLTCAHVVADGHGKVRSKLFLLCNFVAPETDVPHAASAEILDVNLDLDLALLRGGQELKTASHQVTFATADLFDSGAPAAALGFPTQEQPKVSVDGKGETHVSLRLATGFVSAEASPVRLPQTPYTLLNLHHYELNMFAYPGMSGAPLFDLTGAVRGVIRGTKLHEGQVAAYCWADRNREVLEYLTAKKVGFAVADQTA